MDHERFEGDMPFEAVEDGNEGIGEDVVIVDELTIGATGAIRDTPAEVFGRTGEDLGDAAAVLEADFVGGVRVVEATGLDDGEKAPADLGLLLNRELDGDDASGKEAVEHGPEAFADTGGVDDDVGRVPFFGQVLEAAKDGEVVLAGPGVAGEDAVCRALEGLEGGEVDGDDGEGGGIAAGVAEAFAVERGGKAEAGFVHAGDIDQKSICVMRCGL